MNETIWQREWVSSVLHPHQHSIGYTGDGFYRSKDPTNSIKVLKEKAAKEKHKKHKENRKYTHTHKYTNNRYTNKHSKSPSLQ